MKTNELITQLARDVQPVRRLASPSKRGALWLIAAAGYVALGVGMIATGMVPGGANREPVYLLEQGLGITTAMMAALAAFTSVIPGARRSAWAFAAISASAWLGVVLWGCLADLQMYGTFGASSQADWPCVVAMVIGGGALWAVMVPMLRRGVPLAPRLTMLLSGAAALGVANAVACLTQPHAFNSIVLLWHGGTMALLLVFLVTVGQRVIRWPALAR